MNPPPVLAGLEKMKNKLIISGDFNVDPLNINKQNQIGENIVMFTIQIYPKIKLPTDILINMEHSLIYSPLES